VKILILGAGASKPAGYPTANELMPAIAADTNASKRVDLMNAWEQWQNTKKSAPGALRLLLDDPNPEVILSILDLCRLSRSASLEHAVRSEHRAEFQSRAQSDSEIPDSWFTSPHHRWLYEADTARFRLLLDCLIAYFDWRHYSDRGRPECRAYLREKLEKLTLGDLVITFNWDTIAERSLLEADRWSPRDGYGFVRDLRRGDEFDYPPVSRQLAKPSEIRVLKLHGSFGWYRAGGEVYLADDLLNNFLPDEQMPICDLLAHKRGPRPDLDPVIAYPSFLKKLDMPVVLDIWQQADAALREAEAIEVWGYSLPESDAAARVLLNPVRARIPDKEFRIQIHVAGDGEARDRWRTFLPGATVDHAKLG
jgi:hypothetical protein